MAANALIELCKESILDFGGLGIEASYARRLSRGDKKNQLKYNRHMTRYYNPDFSISLGEVLKRIFDIDIYFCTDCGGKDTMKFLAVIQDPRVVEKFLGYIGYPTRPPHIAAARFKQTVLMNCVSYAEA